MTEKVNIKRVQSKINKIRDIIDNQGRYGFYLINNDQVKLVSKSDDKDEAKKQCLEKIKLKEQYIGDYVYSVDIVIDEKYITHEHKLIGGPLSLKIKEYQIDNKFKLKHKANFKNGAIWYTNQDIQNNGFHITDIKKLIKIIHDQNVIILSIGKVRAIELLNEYQ